MEPQLWSSVPAHVLIAQNWSAVCASAAPFCPAPIMLLTWSIFPGPAGAGAGAGAGLGVGGFGCGFCAGAGGAGAGGFESAGGAPFPLPPPFAPRPCSPWVVISPSLICKRELSSWWRLQFPFLGGLGLPLYCARSTRSLLSGVRVGAAEARTRREVSVMVRVGRCILGFGWWWWMVLMSGRDGEMKWMLWCPMVM